MKSKYPDWLKPIPTPEFIEYPSPLENTLSSGNKMASADNIDYALVHSYQSLNRAETTAQLAASMAPRPKTFDASKLILAAIKLQLKAEQILHARQRQIVAKMNYNTLLHLARELGVPISPEERKKKQETSYDPCTAPVYARLLYWETPKVVRVPSPYVRNGTPNFDLNQEEDPELEQLKEIFAITETRTKQKRPIFPCGIVDVLRYMTGYPGSDGRLLLMVLRDLIVINEIIHQTSDYSNDDLSDNIFLQQYKKFRKTWRPGMTMPVDIQLHVDSAFRSLFNNPENISPFDFITLHKWGLYEFWQEHGKAYEKVLIRNMQMGAEGTKGPLLRVHGTWLKRTTAFTKSSPFTNFLKLPVSQQISINFEAALDAFLLDWGETQDKDKRTQLKVHQFIYTLYCNKGNKLSPTILKRIQKTFQRNDINAIANSTISECHALLVPLICQTHEPKPK